MSEVSEAIKRKRESLGMTQEQFAKLYGVTPLAVHKWENGTNKPHKNRLKELNLDIYQTQQPSNARMLNVVQLPVFTTATAASCGAGNGLEYADFEVERMVYEDRSTFSAWDDSRLPFGIHIDGDSMVGAGLSEGSIAIVNPAEDVSDSDTALVSWKDNWFIKWVIYNIDGSVELRSANPNYQPIHIEREYAENADFFRVIGKVVSIIKTNTPKRAY